MTLRIQLRSPDETMVAAWEAEFRYPDVNIAVGDILAITADAILSPANSLGFMDGGIDLQYSYYFGWELQDALRELLDAEHDSELPVGLAAIVPTGNSRFPFLISAPTMRVPGSIGNTVNVYLAFRAALLTIRHHNSMTHQKINSLASPALGAGIGAMPFARVARQMHAAYCEVILGETEWRRTARGILNHHAALLK